jgi:carbamoyltransferase
MRILGISAFYHDAAACLVINGRIIAAAQEERFSRRKHDQNFPVRAIAWCLSHAGIGAHEVDHVVFYEKPFPRFERLIETYLAFAPRGFGSFAASLPAWIKEKLFQKQRLLESLQLLGGTEADWSRRLLFSEHHLSHAASAFFPSPFASAAVLTMDGVGEWATTSIMHGHGNRLDPCREIRFPHSLGLLYSAFTTHAGFRVNSGEYKLMGLAPHGKPVYASRILEHLIDLKDDGSYRLNLDYFDYCTGLAMTNAKFDALFGGPPRQPEAPLSQREMDMAASIQAVTGEVVLRLAREALRVTAQRQLCLAGGVALNAVANGQLLRSGIADRIWIQPAAGDAGGSLGAALAIHHLMLNHSREPVGEQDSMRGALLGPAFTDAEIERELLALNAVYTRHDDEDMLQKTAQALAEGRIVGWMQGRMEFGPRSLGARSILADPRSPEMQRVLNERVKFRETFRPFAPSVLQEDSAAWFALDTVSPYMLLVAPVVGSGLPAVTHVDGSARVQTVHADTIPRFHALLSRFKTLTGCPVLVNTSFNVRGEPPVCSPADAFRCFMGSGLDMLVIGNFLLEKTQQHVQSFADHRHHHAPD